jgi:hypothetical protein
MNPPTSHNPCTTFLYLVVSTLSPKVFFKNERKKEREKALPIVGGEHIISPNLSLFKILVLPQFVKPRINLLQ